jgi:hypothetical protein
VTDRVQAGLAQWRLPWPRPAVPRYRVAEVGTWRLDRLERVPQTGYFQDVLGDGEHWLLCSADEAWMSVSQVEVESHAPHLALAHGHVVLMGAGLGLALWNVLQSPAVTSVTMVEREPDVIELLRRAADLDAWPGRDRLEVVLTDAMTYRPAAGADYLYVDIWPMTGDRRAPGDVRRIQANVGAKLVSWWSQEIDLLRWLAARGRPLVVALEDVAEWAAARDLPLGPARSVDYVAWVNALARGRFFERYCRHREHWDPTDTGPTG